MTNRATTANEIPITYADLGGANRGQRPDLINLQQGLFTTPDGKLWQSVGGQLVTAQNIVPTYATDLTGNVTGLVGPGGNLNSVIGINNKMRKWQGAIGKMRNGVRNAKLLILGDSTGVGAGATGTAGFGAGGRLKSMPVYLASELNRTYYPANCHALWCDGNLGSVGTLASFDTRCAFTGTWAVQLLDGGSLGGRTIKNATETTASYPFAFTPSAAGAPSANVDTFVIWYVVTVGGGTFNWNVDGGASTPVVCSGGANDIASTTVSTTLGAHTLNIWRQSGNIWILGIQAYDSTTKQIEVWQGSFNSAFVSTMNNTAQPWCIAPMIATTAPDLTVIQLQINDAVVAATSLAQYRSNLQTLITTCLAVGDVILRTGYPSAITYNANAALALQKQYRDVIADVALTNDITFDDVWTRMGSYEIQQALPGGSMYADSLHPTGNVYASSASNLAKILRAY